MGMLFEKLSQRLPELRTHYRNLVKQHGSVKVSDVTVAGLYGGGRGVNGLLGDTASVCPDRGLLCRGKTVPELSARLPEEIWHLLLTGELPNADELADLRREWSERSKVPGYVFDVLRAMPPDSHPMAMFATAVLVMERESIFRRRYDEGLRKDDYWEAAFADATNLIPKLPEIGAFIYRTRFGKGAPIAADPSKDWAAGVAHMPGRPAVEGRFTRLLRLYLTLHCDHEGGNVCAFSAHTIGSALSDLYYAYAGGVGGLAGPLHGLANQECLAFIQKTMERFGGVPTEDQLATLIGETLAAGQVVPGYGHAVLRVADPRFTAFRAFGLENCPESPEFQTMNRLFQVAPGILGKVEKIKNPFPNVDAASGVLLHHFGLREYSFYTVLFAISRSLGVCAQNILHRAMGSPLVRPKSLTGEELALAIARARQEMEQAVG